MSYNRCNPKKTELIKNFTFIDLFPQLFPIPVNLFGGMIVDRFNSKKLMMLGDTIASLLCSILADRIFEPSMYSITKRKKQRL